MVRCSTSPYTWLPPMARPSSIPAVRSVFAIAITSVTGRSRGEKTGCRSIATVPSAYMDSRWQR